MSDDDVNKSIETLLRKAANDYMSAIKLIENPPIILDTAAFHCQQAIEKYLKAYLIFLRVDYPKTHNLETLLDLVRSSDTKFDSFHFFALSTFAVEIRYTDEYFIPDIDEIYVYLNLVQQIEAIILSKIKIN